MKNKSLGVKITIILFAIIYFIIGVAEIIEGADVTSKFYIYDNIAIRILGGMFIVSSIGILFKKQFAYKLLVITSLLSIAEGILTFNTMGISKIEVFSFLMLIFIIYLPPIIGFSFMDIKRYFNMVDKSHNKNIDSEEAVEESTEDLPQSKLGVASFVLALISVTLFIILIVLLLKNPFFGMEESLTNMEIATVVILFIDALTCFVGLGLGIASVVIKKRKRVYSTLGIFLNSIIALFYIAVIVASISMIKEGQYQFKESPSEEYTHSQTLFKFSEEQKKFLN